MADPRMVQLVDRMADKYGVPKNLARALVNQESGYNPSARSPVGAGGLMQLMPGTAAGLGVQNVFDPVQNADGGMRMVSRLLQQYKGNVKLALAAYNAGSGAVAKYGGVPPYKETQNYVKTIMAKMGQGGLPEAAWGGGAGDTGKPLPPGTGGETGLAGMTASPLAQSISDLFSKSLPSQSNVSILQKLGGTAGRVAQSAQMAEPYQAPQVAQPQQSQGQTGGGQDPYQPVQVIPHGPGLDGRVPMHVGGQNPYTNLQFAGHVDFKHVNPRLLDALNKEAKKLGGVISVISGYRSNDYSQRTGGFAGDPHSKGLAVDAYIHGHPIGEVVGPEVWAKYGIRSGNTPGFYKGKPDPEHLDLMGVPVKQPKRPKA